MSGPAADVSRACVSWTTCRIQCSVFSCLPLQGFAFTGTDEPGSRANFLPLTYLANLLSDIEKQGSVCLRVC